MNVGNYINCEDSVDLGKGICMQFLFLVQLHIVLLRKFLQHAHSLYFSRFPYDD